MGSSLVRTVRRAIAVIRVEGPRETARRIVSRIRVAIGHPPRAYSDYVESKQREDAAYDDMMQTDTGGIQHLDGLVIRSDQARFGTPHIASAPHEFRQAMALLDVPLAGCVFVDLGSGKGRALMLAAEYPFSRIIGVEFAEELYDISLQNIGRLNDGRMSCILGDATDFDFPRSDLIVFMFNPFDRPVVGKIAEKLVRSYNSDPRVMRVVYLNPRACDAFSADEWSVVKSGPGISILAPRQAA